MNNLMASITQAAMAASILVGLASIPAVSKSAAAGEETQVSLENVSERSASEKVVKKSDSDSFYGSIESAFEEFETYVNQDRANATLVSPSARTEMKRSYSNTTWRMSSSSGQITLVESPSRTLVRVETAEGTLEEVREDGSVEESFEGSDRQKVERAKIRLMSRLEARKETMEERSTRLASDGGTEPGVELVANSSTGSGYGNNSEEHVILENTGIQEIDLQSWKIGNNNPDFYTFGDVKIGPGERLRVYSKEVDADDAVTETGLTWEDGGDTAALKNSDGETVAEESY